jgi:hypothetical protein
MKVALFRDPFDHVHPWKDVPYSGGYVQVSGWVDIEFPALTDAERKVADDLTELNKRQVAVDADFRRQRKALEEERAALLKTGT